MTSLQLASPDLHFVAFLDILGFSNMVKSDFESSPQNKTYLNKLFQIYNYTSKIDKSNLDLNVMQFSDSIVLSVPYSDEFFSPFISVIAKYQYDLFCKGILCRGGIAYGKHFFQEGFLFSNGLIEAYKIESETAKHPRIVVSNDLIQLIYKTGEIDDNVYLIKENDGLFFVDFVGDRDIISSARNLESILNKNQDSNPSVKEKLRWLTEYFDYKISQSGLSTVKFGQPRFSKNGT